MALLTFLNKSSTYNGLCDDIKRLGQLHGKRKRRAADCRTVDTYLRQPHCKLHVGCGPNILPGWLNGDLSPVSPTAIHLNATNRFPFDSQCFDYVYSEHMIEHLTFEQGTYFLSECHRVLKPGGKLRIATPDLGRLLGLYIRSDHPDARRYIEWMRAFALVDKPDDGVDFIINNAFRAWGHQFLYNERRLGDCLLRSGFANVNRFAPGISDDASLRGLEHHGKSIGDEAINEFETMVLEASRQ